MNTDKASRETTGDGSDEEKLSVTAFRSQNTDNGQLFYLCLGGFKHTHLFMLYTYIHIHTHTSKHTETLQRQEHTIRL